jgi:hypothetical protein
MRVSEHINSPPTGYHLGFEKSGYAVYWIECGGMVGTKL